MIQPALGNFIPIAILMFTHLSNVTSIQELIKLKPSQQSTATINKSYDLTQGFNESTENKSKYSMTLPMSREGELYPAEHTALMQ